MPTVLLILFMMIIPGKLRAFSDFNEIRNRSEGIFNYGKSTKGMDKTIAITFVGENLPPGGGTWMYPAGSGYPIPGMTDAKAHEGDNSLEVELKADVYSGGAVCASSPVNLSDYFTAGMLQIWIQGDRGGEVMNIGLMDDGTKSGGRNLQVWVNSRSYSPVAKGKWIEIKVPLQAMGKRGSYWSEEQNARKFHEFNWGGVTCFNIDIDKERHKTFKVWLDDVMVFKKGFSAGEGGENTYPWFNEDYDDFAPEEKDK